MRRFGIFLLLAAVSISCVKEMEMAQEIHTEDIPDRILLTKVTGRTEGELVPGTLLVYLDEELTSRWETGDSALVAETVSGGIELLSFAPALAAPPKNMELARELGLHRWFAIGFDSALPLGQTAARVAASEKVCAVQFNSLASCAPAGMAMSADSGPDLPLGTNDPYSHYQWNLLNDGSLADMAQEGFDINVVPAWKLTSGDPRVIVAICDGPVKHTHPDLAGNMWVNEDEIPGNGIDDDENGYTDDVYGYNFAESKGEINWNGYGEMGHGTHVAGIIGAVNNNGIGVSSVAGGSGTGDGIRMMSCQIFSGDETADDRGVGNAFIYAADNGACIAQCSYGYNGGTYKSDNAYINVWPFEYRAIQYFINPENANCAGVGANIAVFAAGNEMTSYSAYPGALPDCVSVTALGPDGLPAVYTNYGLGCNIAAPGGDNGYTQECMILSTGLSEVGSEYVYMSGSSMACPHVSGVAALGMSYALKTGKTFTGDEFKAMLYASVNDVDTPLASGGQKTSMEYGSISLKSYYKRMGTGSIDAWKMLMQVEGTPSVMVRTGETCDVALDKYFGGGASGMTYLGVDVSDEARQILGISGTPKVGKGVMSIKCTKRGSAKVTVRAIAGGGQTGGPTGTGGTEISREVSVISRGVFSANNGWL